MAGTAICEAFLIDFGCYFGFFTSEIISEYFVMHFRFLDGKLKKKILRQGGLPPAYSLVCCYIWSCVLLLPIHNTVEWIK